MYLLRIGSQVERCCLPKATRYNLQADDQHLNREWRQEHEANVTIPMFCCLVVLLLCCVVVLLFCCLVVVLVFYCVVPILVFGFCGCC